MTTHPQHQHPLKQTDPARTYPEYGGQWACDNCVITYDRTHKPHHCDNCSYDLCQNCFTPKKHPRHVHELYLSKMQNVYPQYNGDWKCDACQQRKGPPTEPMAYHCFHCVFDLCGDCFKGRDFAIHRHRLVPADAAKIYNNPPAYWICDCCKRSGASMGTQYSWHCSECEFDCCERCLEEVRVTEHAHPLKITDSNKAYPNYQGCWQCDLCQRNFNPQNPGNNVDKPYHCYTCQFDACHDCMNPLLDRGPQGDTHVEYDYTGPPASAYRTFPTPAAETRRVDHQPPIEMMEDDDGSVENLDESQKCIVCCAKPKSATIVHGSTGHVCCCLTCAYTLWKRGDKCPMCRASIDRVIKHYNV